MTFVITIIIIIIIIIIIVIIINRRSKGGLFNYSISICYSVHNIDGEIGRFERANDNPKMDKSSLTTD